MLECVQLRWSKYGHVGQRLRRLVRGQLALLKELEVLSPTSLPKREVDYFFARLSIDSVRSRSSSVAMSITKFRKDRS